MKETWQNKHRMFLPSFLFFQVPSLMTMLQPLTIRLTFVSVMVSLVWCRAKGVVKTSPNGTVPAVIVFGDSVVDAGNNNGLRTVVKCDFRPYGKDFEGRVPTGRFSNGKIPSDMIAEALGIKDLIPAYLDPKLQAEDLPTGVTFASGGSGYDWLTPKLLSVISLPEQLEHFKEYIGRLKVLVGENETSSLIANSLFLVVAGSNDIAITYFLLRARKLEYDVQGYTDLLSNSASQFVQELYGLGARRIGVFSAPPVGCLPAQRTLAGGLNRSCAENNNQAALLFNQKLSQMLNSLGQSLPNTKIVYIDTYNPLLDLIQNPQNYGFDNVDQGCCGTGDIEVGILCNRLLPTCSDDSKYVFFDSFHPTEHAYRAIVTPLIQKYAGKFF